MFDRAWVTGYTPSSRRVVSPCGAVAQLGERLNGIQEVEGSTPFGSTPAIGSEAQRQRFRGRASQRVGPDIRRRFPSRGWDLVLLDQERPVPPPGRCASAEVTEEIG